MTTFDGRHPTTRLAQHVERARNTLVHARGPLSEPIVDSDDLGDLIAILIPPWIIGFRLVTAGGNTVVHDVVMKMMEVGISVADWHSPDLDEALVQAREGLAKFQKSERRQRAQLKDNEDHLADLFDTWTVRARRRGAAEYAALAAMYVREIEKGNTAPVEALAKTLGLSPVTVAQRVREARAKKLLSAPLVGSTGGRLTPLALAYLDPAFPGVGALRAEGLSLEDIRDTYQIPEDQVLRAVADAGVAHESGPARQD